MWASAGLVNRGTRRRIALVAVTALGALLANAASASAASVGSASAATLFGDTGTDQPETLPAPGTAAPTKPPVNAAAPTISGTTEETDTLTATTGSWGDFPTSYSYRWQDCTAGTCTNIPGATSKTYVLQYSEVGDTVDVVVTATNGSGIGTSSARSATVPATGTVAPTYYTTRLGALYAPSTGGIWNTPLSANAPIDEDSQNLVDNVLMPYADQGNFTNAGGPNLFIATSRSEPAVTVTLVNSEGQVVTTDPQLQQTLDNVPWPPYAQPTTESDHHMAILQPSTGCIWEFWKLANDGTQNDPDWTAQWGGRMCNVFNKQPNGLGQIGVFQNVVDSSGDVLEQPGWGAPATSFPLMAGTMMVNEISQDFSNGTPTGPDHAVAFAIGNLLTGTIAGVPGTNIGTCLGGNVTNSSGQVISVWNDLAQRSDGSVTPEYDHQTGELQNCIPEGARFRLPPPCPPGRANTLPGSPGKAACYNLSTLEGDPPLVQELAYAAQNYGLITNNSTAGLSIFAEDSDSNSAAYQALGGNPYTQRLPGVPNSPFQAYPGTDNVVRNGALLGMFPWAYVELMQMNLTDTDNNTRYTAQDLPCGVWPAAPC